MVAIAPPRPRAASDATQWARRCNRVTRSGRSSVTRTAAARVLPKSVDMVLGDLTSLPGRAETLHGSSTASPWTAGQLWCSGDHGRPSGPRLAVSSYPIWGNVMQFKKSAEIFVGGLAASVGGALLIVMATMGPDGASGFMALFGLLTSLGGLVMLCIGAAHSR